MEYKRDVRICSVHASKKKRLTKMIWGASKSAVLDVPRSRLRSNQQLLMSRRSLWKWRSTISSAPGRRAIYSRMSKLRAFNGAILTSGPKGSKPMFRYYWVNNKKSQKWAQLEHLIQVMLGHERGSQHSMHACMPTSISGQILPHLNQSVPDHLLLCWMPTEVRRHLSKSLM